MYPCMMVLIHVFASGMMICITVCGEKMAMTKHRLKSYYVYTQMRSFACRHIYALSDHANHYICNIVTRSSEHKISKSITKFCSRYDKLFCVLSCKKQIYCCLLKKQISHLPIIPGWIPLHTVHLCNIFSLYNSLLQDSILNKFWIY